LEAHKHVLVTHHHLSRVWVADFDVAADRILQRRSGGLGGDCHDRRILASWCAVADNSAAMSARTCGHFDLSLLSFVLPLLIFPAIQYLNRHAHDSGWFEFMFRVALRRLGPGHGMLRGGVTACGYSLWAAIALLRPGLDGRRRQRMSRQAVPPAARR